MSHLTWARKRTPKELINEWPEEKITVPNTTPSLRKLLEQHSRGMPLPQSKEGQYFGDIELPDFDQMDPIEVKEYRDNLRDDIDELRSRQKAEANKARSANQPPPEAAGQGGDKPTAKQTPPEGNPNQSDMVKAIREAFKLE